MSDSNLHRAVMEALADNPHAARGDSARGATVGSSVPPAVAGRPATRVPGVRHVEDGLQVRLMGIDGRADADTEAAVLDALAADDVVHARDIEVEVKDGAVTLRGLVEVVSQRERAERVVLGVPGVVSVDHRLRVWLTVS